MTHELRARQAPPRTRIEMGSARRVSRAAECGAAGGAQDGRVMPQPPQHVFDFLPPPHSWPASTELCASPSESRDSASMSMSRDSAPNASRNSLEHADCSLSLCTADVSDSPLPSPAVSGLCSLCSLLSVHSHPSELCVRSLLFEGSERQYRAPQSQLAVGNCNCTTNCSYLPPDGTATRATPGPRGSHYTHMAYIQGRTFTGI